MKTTSSEFIGSDLKWLLFLFFFEELLLHITNLVVMFNQYVQPIWPYIYIRFVMYMLNVRSFFGKLTSLTISLLTTTHLSRLHCIIQAFRATVFTQREIGKTGLVTNTNVNVTDLTEFKTLIRCANNHYHSPQPYPLSMLSRYEFRLQCIKGPSTIGDIYLLVQSAVKRGRIKARVLI